VPLFIIILLSIVYAFIVEFNYSCDKSKIEKIKELRKTYYDYLYQN